MVERWLPVPGYEGIYEVSNMGGVRSVDRTVPATFKSGKITKKKIKGKLFKPRTNSMGYFWVELRKNNKGKMWFVHRLVAITFLPEITTQSQVAHIDNNKTNNRADNLMCAERKRESLKTKKSEKVLDAELLSNRPRVVGDNGYKKIRCPEHPNVDASGYVYEHRLVVEEHIGKFLKKGEVVHHRNHNRLDNDIDNLELFESATYHKVEHRSPHSKKKLPDEPNVVIQCACGCGNTLLKYDSYNRPRKRIYGHRATTNLPKLGRNAS